jgi:hypothetical protein
MRANACFFSAIVSFRGNRRICRTTKQPDFPLLSAAHQNDMTNGPRPWDIKSCRDLESFDAATSLAIAAGDID